jgi:hypothetical protein
VQSGTGIAIVPRSVALSLFRRLQPMSRRNEVVITAVRDALKDPNGGWSSEIPIVVFPIGL